MISTPPSIIFIFGLLLLTWILSVFLCILHHVKHFSTVFQERFILGVLSVHIHPERHRTDDVKSEPLIQPEKVK